MNIIDNNSMKLFLVKHFFLYVIFDVVIDKYQLIIKSMLCGVFIYMLNSWSPACKS